MSFEWKKPIPFPNSYKTTKNDYDLELLPRVIKDAAKEVARFSKVPIASPALTGLSCVAVAIGKKSIVIEKQGLEHYPSLFFVLIAGSGERKSPIFSYMKHPIDEWCKEKMDKYEEDKKHVNAVNLTADIELTAIKVLIKKAVNKKSDTLTLQQELMDNEDKRLEVPPTPSFYTTDTTEERLFQKMHERNEAYAVMSGEGRGALDQILGKYTSGGGTGDALYLAGITGDTVTRDRVGKSDSPEEMIMYKPCLNVCIMVQPDKYQEVSSHPSLRESGALARIWSIHLPSLVGTRFEEENEAGLSPSIMDNYNHMIKAILDANPPEIDGESVHKVTLSKDVIRARRVFHNQIEKMMATGDKLEDVRDIASKTVSQTVKMAQILHIANNPELLNQSESMINIETWTKAESLGKFHLNEAVRVQRSAATDVSVVYAGKILNWIIKHRHNEIKVSDVQRYVRPKTNATNTKLALNVLYEYNYLSDKGSKYLVNPMTL
jgi:hypothetical protein